MFPASRSSPAPAPCFSSLQVTGSEDAEADATFGNDVEFDCGSTGDVDLGR